MQYTKQRDQLDNGSDAFGSRDGMAMADLDKTQEPVCRTAIPSYFNPNGRLLSFVVHRPWDVMLDKPLLWPA